jgi:hypothetical protein
MKELQSLFSSIMAQRLPRLLSYNSVIWAQYQADVNETDHQSLYSSTCATKYQHQHYLLYSWQSPWPLAVAFAFGQPSSISKDSYMFCTQLIELSPCRDSDVLIPFQKDIHLANTSLPTNVSISTLLWLKVSFTISDTKCHQQVYSLEIKTMAYMISSPSSIMSTMAVP